MSCEIKHYRLGEDGILLLSNGKFVIWNKSTYKYMVHTDTNCNI